MGDQGSGDISVSDTHGEEQALRHVAIIMDGNGRWARDRGLPRVEGHRQGVEAVRRTVRAAIELGIPYLTLYSFSSENWSRPQSEIIDLLGLLKRFIRQDLATLHKKGVRVRIIGERVGLENEIVSLLSEAETLTRDNKALNLVVAFNYGSRAEIIGAARKFALAVRDDGVDPGALDETMFGSYLDTHDIPDPDLLIRTSGEKRLSNFLLWQLAYTEFMFVDCYWPDFGFDQLDQARHEFLGRERRFGGLSVRTSA